MPTFAAPGAFSAVFNAVNMPAALFANLLPSALFLLVVFPFAVPSNVALSYVVLPAVFPFAFRSAAASAPAASVFLAAVPAADAPAAYSPVFPAVVFLAGVLSVFAAPMPALMLSFAPGIVSAIMLALMPASALKPAPAPKPVLVSAPALALDISPAFGIPPTFAPCVSPGNPFCELSRILFIAAHSNLQIPAYLYRLYPLSALLV